MKRFSVLQQVLAILIMGYLLYAVSNANRAAQTAVVDFAGRYICATTSEDQIACTFFLSDKPSDGALAQPFTRKDIIDLPANYRLLLSNTLLAQDSDEDLAGKYLPTLWQDMTTRDKDLIAGVAQQVYWATFIARLSVAIAGLLLVLGLYISLRNLYENWRSR